jgi:hypothetical protein
VVVASAGLVDATPYRPGVAEGALGAGQGGGGQAQEAAGFGDADLDHADLGWGRLAGAGWQRAGIGPVRGLGTGAGRAERLDTAAEEIRKRLP